MECLICGKDYIALGVHIRHKHKMDPADYREEFGMLRTAPLCDPDLSKMFQDSMLRQVQDPERKAQMQAVCLANAQAAIGHPSPGSMSRAGKDMLSRRNRERNARYLASKSLVVADILRQHKSIHAVRKIIGMGRGATKAIIKQGFGSYNKDDALALRLQTAIATLHAKRAERVAAYKKAIIGAQSAASACRMAGVNKRTYQNWIAAGLIDRHPNTSRIGPCAGHNLAKTSNVSAE